MLDGMPPALWFMRREMRRRSVGGMSVPQYRAMVVLDSYPLASLSTLAENLGSAMPAASRLIDGMVRKGFVSRKPVPSNRRQMTLTLTAKGRAAMNASRQAMQRRISDEIAHLTDAQRATIVKAMLLMRDVFSRPVSS